MAQKKELTEQEKIALILKNSGVNYDPKKAEAQIALNTRCKRCGHVLSSLERVVFNDKCAKCMGEETAVSRDKFVKKYIIIVFAFIASLIIGAYCASPSASSKGWTITGTVFSSIVTGISLVYVFYTNMDKMFPRIPQKAQVWCCFTIALLVDFALCLLIVLVKSWIFYFLLMLGVGAYIAYIAYGEYNRINERYNLIRVYNRKSMDKEYVESITASLENRAKEEAEDTSCEEKVNDEVVDASEITSPDAAKTDATEIPVAVTDKNEKKDIGKLKNDIAKSPDTAEESDDSGDFSI